ncbi:NUDIX domain-containing protein [Aquibacillus koreensis]|uniref:NUDIX domain-containing protein n=1 Tax=Aquibacillus koreensis TaxID=279446 RepID=A0A9X4AL09_9BACI|nr:NUDIX domain-containing protein [Aquibacillus koreensis]MCT2536878.1 NUDIX domain-containing protein [Aquibacillus koreensis]MDC3421990.1 NUDIX domain-containing protein [Aquibacillus koreensis]
MRDRGSVILIKNHKVALIKRIRKDSTYYVFPGGGIETGETPESASKREVLEELGVEVKINNCISKVNYRGGVQYFFLAELIGGTFGSGQGEEYTDVDRDRGTYIPIWMDIEELVRADVKPKEVAFKISNLFNNTKSE